MTDKSLILSLKSNPIHLFLPFCKTYTWETKKANEIKRDKKEKNVMVGKDKVMMGHIPSSHVLLKGQGKKTKEEKKAFSPSQKQLSGSKLEKTRWEEMLPRK